MIIFCSKPGRAQSSQCAGTDSEEKGEDKICEQILSAIVNDMHAGIEFTVQEHTFIYLYYHKIVRKDAYS